MKEYILNFFLWWYVIKVNQFARRVVGLSVYVLEYTNTLPMAQNFFVPLYQDESSAGRFISFIVRLVWVWFGGMISLVVILPLIAVLLVYVALPLLLIFQIVFGILRSAAVI